MQEGDMNDNKQNQVRRVVKPNQLENQQEQQPHQPQKCPRCQSLNTKFCYYNNYSLSQPRYFCKTCRRYWTQGGTLRNVPVGGGCRKGKRSKTTSSSSSSGDSSRHSQPPPPPVVLPGPQAAHQNLTDPMMIGSSSVMTSSQFYPAGSGYLASFAAIQSFNQPTSLAQSLLINSGSHHQDHDHQMRLGGLSSASSSPASSSTLSLLQAFNDISGASSFGPTQFYPNPSDHHHHHQEGLNVINQTAPVRPNIASANSSSHHQQGWPDHSSFMISSNTTAGASCETSVWNVGNTNSDITGNVRRNTNRSSDDQPSFSPNQWPHDLSGYGPAPSRS